MNVEEIIAECPKCGSWEINEINYGYIIYPVKTWIVEDEYIYPDDYFPHTLSSNLKIEAKYECNICGEKFLQPKIAETFKA